MSLDKGVFRRIVQVRVPIEDHDPTRRISQGLQRHESARYPETSPSRLSLRGSGSEIADSPLILDRTPPVAAGGVRHLVVLCHRVAMRLA